MDTPIVSPTLDLAERVAEAARGLGIETALIGASALAAHNFVRGTEDVDQLLARNPSADLDAIRARARPFDTNGVLDDLVAEAAQT